ncbi:MAG: acyl-CoA thioesterase [Candidatus Cloacimonetes bacterium]|nr:acyl-CoA thioesterase [Candidatus Cloacimonadota bacterium]MBL7149487.1 acyl-CoA thioesterase [Candidatus Cloacimonadota bacterium]
MNSDSIHLPYEMKINIEATDIDLLGHVNNVVYLRWVQDVAIAHWFAVATESQKKKLLWVVVRHEIDYKRPAYAGDTVIARTWVGLASRRAFERHTELIRKSDRKLLARARTLWCPIDSNTRKPVDVDADVYERFSTQNQTNT